MKKLFAYIFLLIFSFYSLTSNEILIEKFYTGNLTTGNNLQIGYIIENKVDKDIVVKIRDKNTINDAGFNVECLQLTIPKNQKIKYVYDQRLFLNKAGNFTLEPAIAEYTIDGKKKEVKSNSINLEITGKEYNTKYITNIYRCDGINRKSSQYSQIGSSSIVISNGNIIVDDFFNTDDDFDKIFQEMEERMNQIRKQMYQQIQQINQPKNYQQYVPNYVPDYDEVQSSIDQNNVNNQNNIQTKQTLNRTTNSMNRNNQQKNQSSMQRTTANSSSIADKINQRIANKNNKNNFRNLLLWLILLLIASLIIIYLLLNKNKKQPEAVEEIKEKSIYQYFKQIRKEFEIIEQIKKDKKKYLKFKDLVAEFKDKIEGKVSEEIIENINMFLYADKKENLEFALNDLEKIIKRL